MYLLQLGHMLDDSPPIGPGRCSRDLCANEIRIEVENKRREGRMSNMRRKKIGCHLESEGDDEIRIRVLEMWSSGQMGGEAHFIATT